MKRYTRVNTWADITEGSNSCICGFKNELMSQFFFINHKTAESKDDTLTTPGIILLSCLRSFPKKPKQSFEYILKEFRNTIV